MARTHPFAETGARPKPRATEGVTPTSIPPATQAVEDEMLTATALLSTRSGISAPDPPGDQPTPLPVTRVKERILATFWSSAVRRLGHIPHAPQADTSGRAG